MQDLQPPEGCSWQQWTAQMSIAVGRLSLWPACSMSLAAQDEDRFTSSLLQAGALRTHKELP